MARQSANAKVETPATQNNGTSEFTKDQIKNMAVSLKAAEEAITENLGLVAQCEYSIGLKLRAIRDEKLYLAAKPDFQTFNAYLDARVGGWRMGSRMTAYNYINLTALSQDKVEVVGLTNAAKIGAAMKLDPKAGAAIVEKVEAAVEEGKAPAKVNTMVVDLTKKIRDKANAKRSPGRGKAKEEKAQADMAEIKEAKAAPTDEIADKEHVVEYWKDLPADKATKNGYTKVAIVEVAGYRLEIRSSSAVVDVKVVATKE